MAGRPAHSAVSTNHKLQTTNRSRLTSLPPRSTLTTMIEPGSIYASVDDRRECLVLALIWNQGSLPRVEYVERNGPTVTWCCDRQDVFNKQWEYCSVTRPASMEPKR